jgi:hypothetical protein
LSVTTQQTTTPTTTHCTSPTFGGGSSYCPAGEWAGILSVVGIEEGGLVCIGMARAYDIVVVVADIVFRKTLNLLTVLFLCCAPPDIGILGRFSHLLGLRTRFLSYGRY